MPAAGLVVSVLVARSQNQSIDAPANSYKPDEAKTQRLGLSAEPASFVMTRRNGATTGRVTPCPRRSPARSPSAPADALRASLFEARRGARRQTVLPREADMNPVVFIVLDLKFRSPDRCDLPAGFDRYPCLCVSPALGNPHAVERDEYPLARCYDAKAFQHRSDPT
jgi:hypothetical protein